MRSYQGSKIEKGNVGMGTICILHGWQSSKEKWQEVKNELERAGINVIIPDLPGFKKENQLTRAWGLDDYVNWLQEFVTSFLRSWESGDSNKIFLLGHSFGGRIAIKFASKYPEKLSGLVLVSAAGVMPRPKTKIVIFSMFSKIGRLIFSLPFLRFFRPLARKFVYFLAGANDYRFIKEEHLRQTFRNVISENLIPLLPQIKMPTLIIWGRRDKMTPLKGAYLIKEKIKDSKLEVLESIGHLPYLENPGLLSEKIIEFLKSHGKIHDN